MKDRDPIEDPETQADFDAAVAEAETMRSKVSMEIFNGHRGSVCRMALAMLGSELIEASPHGVYEEMSLISHAIIQCCESKGLKPQDVRAAKRDNDLRSMTNRVLKATQGASGFDLFNLFLAMMGGVFQRAPENEKAYLKQRIQEWVANDMVPPSLRKNESEDN